MVSAMANDWDEYRYFIHKYIFNFTLGNIFLEKKEGKKDEKKKVELQTFVWVPFVSTSALYFALLFFCVPGVLTRERYAYTYINARQHTITPNPMLLKHPDDIFCFIFLPPFSLPSAERVGEISMEPLEFHSQFRALFEST